MGPGGGKFLAGSLRDPLENGVSCPPAQRAHAQAGERGGYKDFLET